MLALIPSIGLAKDRPVIPKGVAWVPEPTETCEIVSALSGSRPSARAGPPTRYSPVVRNGRVTKTQPKLPAWRVVVPVPEQELRSAYEEGQSNTGATYSSCPDAPCA